MAVNGNGQASTQIAVRQSNNAKYSEEEWNNVKAAVHRMLFEETPKKSLKVIMESVRESDEIDVGRTTWWKKLKEWGFTKSRPSINTEPEPEDSLQAERSFNFHSDAEPEDSLQSQRSFNFHSDAEPEDPLQSQRSFDFHSDSEPEDPLQSERLCIFLSDADQSWSVNNISHQLDDHERTLSRISSQLAEIDALTLSDGVSNHGTGSVYQRRLHIGYHSMLGVYSFSQDDNKNELSQDDPVVDILSLAVTLAEYQHEYGEFAPATLKQEFKVAKLLGKIGSYEEAEYRCRRILSQFPTIEVQAFLGIILIEMSNVEESLFLLFCAITRFILNFNDHTMGENEEYFISVRQLFHKVLVSGYQDWTSMIYWMRSIETTIQEGVSNGRLDLIPSQLFIHGFSIAYECFSMKLIKPAKYMYELLFENYFHFLDTTIHGIQIAAAHQRYSSLVSKEENWTTAADHLLKACESAERMEIYNTVFFAGLESNILSILPHIKGKSRERDLRKAANGIRNQLDPLLPQDRGSSAAIQDSHLEKFLSGLPRTFAIFDVSLRNMPPQVLGKRSHPSTESASITSGSSCKIALTHSDGDPHIMNDSAYYLALVS